MHKTVIRLSTSHQTVEKAGAQLAASAVHLMPSYTCVKKESTHEGLATIVVMPYLMR